MKYCIYLLCDDYDRMTFENITWNTEGNRCALEFEVGSDYPDGLNDEMARGMLPIVRKVIESNIDPDETIESVYGRNAYLSLYRRKDVEDPDYGVPVAYPHRSDEIAYLPLVDRRFDDALGGIPR